MKDFISKNKKIFILLLIVLFVCTSVSALPQFKIDAQESSLNNNWDTPFIMALISFGNALYAFMAVAQVFCTFFFFLNICYQSFKLWFSATEIRKVVVDLIYKLLMVTLLMNVYPKIIDGVVSTSTNMAINNTNGANQLSNEIVILYRSVYNTTLNSMDIMNGLLKDGNIKKLSESDIKKIGDAIGKSSEDVVKELQDANKDFKVGRFSKLTNNGWNKAKIAMGVVGAVAGAAIVIGTAGLAAPAIAFGAALGAGAGWFGTNVVKAGYDSSQNNTIQNLKQVINDPELSSMLILCDAFNECFGMKMIDDKVYDAIEKHGLESKEAVDAMMKNKNDVESEIKSYLAQPYLQISYEDEIVNINNGKKETVNKYFNTCIISPAVLMRLAIMEAQILRSKSRKKVVTDNGLTYIEEDKVDLTKPQLFSRFTSWLLKLVLPWLFLIPVIYCIIQYIVCILEYYLITSIGIIFIPLLLFDPTKQYASKLLNMFMSYFFKIFFITTITYFCMGNLLTTGRNVIFNSNSFTIQTLSYAIFNFFLTMVLSQGAPKLAMTLLTGNPEMSLGDVANVGRQIGHAYHMGSHAAHDISRKASAAGKVLRQGAKQTGESAVSRFQNRQAAVNQGREFAYGKAAELGMDQSYLNAHRVKDAKGNNIGFDKEGNKYIDQHLSAARKADSTSREHEAYNEIHKQQTSATRQMNREDRHQRTAAAFGYNTNIGKKDGQVAGGVGALDDHGQKQGVAASREQAQKRAANIMKHKDTVAPPPTDE